MGICMDTGRKGFAEAYDSNGLTSNGFGSWPKETNGSVRQRYSRVQQSRTMSEPIMVVSATEKANATGPSETSSSGPGPPRRIALTLQRKVEPINAEEITDVPIIFVLGGPGSGKITHCDRLARMDDRLAHINMQTAFLEVASETGSRDPNSVPAYRALEVLVSRLVEQKGARAFIVSGYPRNMRDVVEFLARVNRVDGVVLLDWSDRSLERQIQIGAKGGGIDVNLARLELNNYRANVIPVTQFFSQQGQLNIVAGQRPPGEVFDDLVEEINGILFHALGESLPVTNPDVPPETNGERAAEIHPAGPGETEVVVHTHADMNGDMNNTNKRRESIDSVDLMIAEEIRNITSDAHVEEDKSNEVIVNGLPVPNEEKP